MLRNDIRICQHGPVQALWQIVVAALTPRCFFYQNVCVVPVEVPRVEDTKKHTIDAQKETSKQKQEIRHAPLIFVGPHRTHSRKTAPREQSISHNVNSNNPRQTCGQNAVSQGTHARLQSDSTQIWRPIEKLNNTAPQQRERHN